MLSPDAFVDVAGRELVDAAPVLFARLPLAFIQLAVGPVLRAAAVLLPGPPLA